MSHTTPRRTARRISTVLGGLALAGLLAAGCSTETPSEPEPVAPGASGTDQPLEDRDPGRVTMRRLNRAEYDNTVRDLLGTNLRLAEDFPPDDTGHGFDNIGDVLSLSPLHLELYERAADRLVREIMRAPLEAPIALSIEAEQVAVESQPAPAGAAYQGSGWITWTDDAFDVAYDAPITGTYRYEVRLFAIDAGDEPVRADVTIDGTTVRSGVEVSGTVDAPTRIVMAAFTDEGAHSIGVQLLNPMTDAEIDAADARRALGIDRVDVSGPTDFVPPEEAPRTRVMLCEPGVDGLDPENADAVRTCTRDILKTFAARAWRRPVEPVEIDRLMALVDGAKERGRDFEQRVSLGLKAILVSPHFYFRPEPVAAESDAGEAVVIDDYAYASRLSYFLWGSMPDDQLFAAAANGLASDPAEIERQVRRMLDDPRSEALVDNFAGQWLFIRDIANVFPDVWVFPEFDEALRRAMAEEMRQFFRTFIVEDRDLRELLTAQEVWVNRRLAEHYGVAYPDGREDPTEFVRVPLDAGHPRTGALTQAGLLTVLSAPHRTSIVRRGKWIMEQMLCSPPPDPPPGVEGLPEDQADVDPTASLRERLVQHRSKPQCAACHETMDELGFALEHYDGVGAWRDMDGNFEVDALGRLPDGTEFHGALELQEMLADDERYSRCVVKKAMTFALGRGMTPEDRPYIDDLARGFADRGHTFEELAVLIALSDPFRFKTVPAADQGDAQ